MKKYKNYIVSLILIVYILRDYLSLVLNWKGIISDDQWVYAHYVGACVMLCVYLLLLKDTINKFVFSLSLSFYTSRLYTQIMYSGKEDYIGITGDIYVFEFFILMIATVAIYLIIRLYEKWRLTLNK